MAHTGWARNLPAMLERHGRQALAADAQAAVLHGASPLARLYRLSGQRARQPVLHTGLLQAANYDAALALLDDPDLWAFGACTVAAGCQGHRPA